MPKSSKVVWSVVLALLSGIVVFGAGNATDEELETRAAAFVELFMEGKYGEYGGMMSPDMKAAMSAESAERILAGLTNVKGVVKRFGEPWKEDVVQGYTRIRVPVEFERDHLDMRIVFDGEALVAGFFHVAHAEPPGKETEARVEPNPDLEGHWEGTIDVPGSPLPVIVDLSYEEGSWSGSFASPMQSVADVPLTGFEVEGGRVRFTIEGIPGEPTFEGVLKGGSIEGTFTQMGQGFPFKLGRETVDLPDRPQEPQRPLPYGEEEVSYKSGEIILAGTLTLPPGEGPHPAALLISGSGPQNRDEEVFGHKPFLVLSDHLTRAGIAVLRVDDRGVGGSTGDLPGSSSAELAEDALAGVRFLGAREEIDPGRIGLIGHSEGGIIGPLVASTSEAVAFVVMLAGTAVPGDAVLVRQMELILRSAGMEEKGIEEILALQRELIGLVKQDAEFDEVLEQMRKLTASQMKATPASAHPSPEDLEEALRQETNSITSPWFRFFLTHDPAGALVKVKVPVLALFGELDLQVDPRQNLPKVEQALKKSGNTDFTVKSLPGLNHLFQKAETGAIGEYAAIEETMNPSALEAVSGWILDRFGKPAQTPAENQ
jgi:pimeloyl-ACP methyl ester carboxylesterase